MSAANASALAAEVKTFKYDTKGRLIQVKSSGHVPAERTTDYTYDKAENRIREKTVKGPPAP